MGSVLSKKHSSNILSVFHSLISRLDSFAQRQMEELNLLSLLLDITVEEGTKGLPPLYRQGAAEATLE